jgi:hypothetical protein
LTLKPLVIAFWCLLAANSFAQSGNKQHLQFDLAKIGDVVDGRQICEDKGRLQDYPSKTMAEIIASGPKSVPILIGMLTDARMAKTPEPIICFWPGMAIGDIAFCLLEDLFLNSDWTKATIPGVSWNDILGPEDNLPAWEQVHSFIRKHGRKAIQSKWQAQWQNYKDRVFWDPKERCFKLKMA